jgi:hypothetical protein
MTKPTESTHAKIVNALLFQAGWFGCVLGGNAIAAASLLIILLIHAIFFVNTSREWLVVFTFSLTGILIDSALVYLGILQTSTVFAPLWLMCLWVILSITLCHSLSWLQYRLPLASVISAVAGPFSYWAGTQVVDVSLQPFPEALFILAAIWAALLPAGLFLARKLTSNGLIRGPENKISVSKAGSSQIAAIFPVALLIFTLANPLLFSPKANAIQSATTDDIQVIGTAYDLMGEKVLYKELHSITQGPGRHVRYVSPDGETLAKKDVDYSRSATGPNFRQENYWANEISQAQWDGNHLILGFGLVEPTNTTTTGGIEDNTIKQKTLSVDQVVIDAGFDNFIREHWQTLLAGQLVRYEFAFASNLTTLRMRIQLDSCNDKIKDIDYSQTVCFKTEPDNLVFRLLSPPIELTYQRDTQRLQRYRGRGNITNNQGKTLDVDIRYEYI